MSVLTSWDGAWYEWILYRGYPAHPPRLGGHFTQSTIAFFPAYPYLAKLLNPVWPGDPRVALVTVSLAGGLAATIGFALLVEQHWGRDAAFCAAILFAFFPGAFVFSMAYSEGVMLAGAVWCLYFLSRRWWFWAGLAGALATSSRVSGVAVVVACAWAAGVAIARRRDWWALIAPVLSSLGIVGYFAYLWAHTGDAQIWFKVEDEGWKQTQTFGSSAWHSFYQLLNVSNASSVEIILGVGVVFALVALIWLIIMRPPGHILVYALASVAIALSSFDSSRPRFILSAFPLIIPFAVGLRAARWRTLTLAVFASAMCLLIPYYAAAFFAKSMVQAP